VIIAAVRRQGMKKAVGSLADCGLLAAVAPDEVARLARRAQSRQLAPRETYVAYGDALPGFCFVMRGAVILWLGRGKSKRVFRVVGAGESFCEAPSLARAPSPFEVRSQATSVVLAVPSQAIDALVSRNSAFARALVMLLAERVMLALGDLDASTVPAAQRVAAYLGSLAGRNAGAVLPVSKTVLAARLGMKKETLSRMLRALSDDGLISFTGRRFTIWDAKRLAELRRETSA